MLISVEFYLTRSDAPPQSAWIEQKSSLFPLLQRIWQQEDIIYHQRVQRKTYRVLFVWRFFKTPPPYHAVTRKLLWNAIEIYQQFWFVFQEIYGLRQFKITFLPICDLFQGTRMKHAPRKSDSKQHVFEWNIHAWKKPEVVIDRNTLEHTAYRIL